MADKQLVVRREGLPGTIEELRDYISIGNARWMAYQLKVKTIDKLGLSKSYRDNTLKKGLEAAADTLFAEVKMGELLKGIPIKTESSVSGRFGGSKPKLPEGITYKQSHYAQLLESNQEIIVGVLRNAEVRLDELPNRSKVVKTIKKIKRIEARYEKAEQGKGVMLPQNIDLRVGDFREVLSDVPENSIDLILTDPPYGFEFIELWSDLSKFANKVLKPSGYLVSYSGQMYLPEAIKRLSEYLEYYWIFCLYHVGATQIVNGVNIICRWKPVLIYQKQPKKKFEVTKQDYIESAVRQKGEHDWQQGESGVAKLIELFSSVGDLVCDPFLGAGTVAKTCKKMKRNIVGAELNPDSFNIAKASIYDEK